MNKDFAFPLAYTFFPFIYILLALSLAGCASHYDSRKECERGEAAFRGGVAGTLLGSTIGSGSGAVVATVGGALLGRGAGVLGYDQTETDEPDDQRQYVGNWYGKCEPSGYVKAKK